MNAETPAEALDRLRARLHETAASGDITVDHIAQTKGDGPLSIGVIGIFSTGKSTFLNALIRRLLLPTSLSPKTAVPMVITRTTGEELAELIRGNGQIKITALEEAINEGALPDGTDVDELSEFVAHIKLREIRLRLRLPILFDGVEITDTPGLDSPYEEHELLAIRVLRESDVVIYLLDEVVKDADRTALAIGQKHCSRFIFLQTKVDWAKPRSSWDETIEDNAREIAEILGQHVTIFPISALKTLRAGGSEEPAEWGMPKVRELLAKALADRRRLRSVADAKRLLTATEDAAQHSEARAASLAGNEADLEQSLAEIGQRIKLGKVVATRLDPLLAEAGRAVQSFCSAHISGWREELRAAMLPARKGDDVVEQVRVAALKRIRTILGRDAEAEVLRAVTLADGRALKVLYETFGIDVAGPLRGHPQIDVNPPVPRRDLIRRFLDFFGGQQTISEAEVHRIADETSSSLQRELMAAVNASLTQGFAQYFSYVEAAIPNMEAERAALEGQMRAGRGEREDRVARSVETTRALRSLGGEIEALLESLAAVTTSTGQPAG